MRLVVDVRISIRYYLWSSDLHISIDLAFLPKLLYDNSGDRSDPLFLFTTCQRNVIDSFFNYYTNLNGLVIFHNNNLKSNLFLKTIN